MMIAWSLDPVPTRRTQAPTTSGDNSMSESMNSTNSPGAPPRAKVALRRTLGAAIKDLFCKNGGDLLRPVSGGIIHHHQFHARITLVDDGAQARFQRGGGVACRHNDRNERRNRVPRFGRRQWVGCTRLHGGNGRHARLSGHRRSGRRIIRGFPGLASTCFEEMAESQCPHCFLENFAGTQLSNSWGHVTPASGIVHVFRH